MTRYPRYIREGTFADVTRYVVRGVPEEFVKNLASRGFKVSPDKDSLYRIKVGDSSEAILADLPKDLRSGVRIGLMLLTQDNSVPGSSPYHIELRVR